MGSKGNEEDRRRMDLVVQGIPGVFHGKPLFIDATCISPVHGNGSPMPGSADTDRTAADKKNLEILGVEYSDETLYPAIELISLNIEMNGRQNKESQYLIKEYPFN